MNAAHTSLNRAAEQVWAEVAPALPGFQVEVLASVDSTNSELMRRVHAGLDAPTLLVALAQTAGRGRRGRQWHSQPGDALTFSVALPMAPPDWSGLSLAVGVSLAEHLHPDVQLKWPNDLWLAGRKLGGVLIETVHQGSQRQAIVGVGLNLHAPDTQRLFADGDLPAVPPASLDELGAEVVGDLGVWLARLAPALLKNLRRFERQGFAAFARGYAQRDALVGQRLQLDDGATGVGCGVDAQGALLLREAGGAIRAVLSGGLSVRPC